MKCNVCESELKCLAGESAHPDNWYCPNEESHRGVKGTESPPRKYVEPAPEMLRAAVEAGSFFPKSANIYKAMPAAQQETTHD